MSFAYLVSLLLLGSIAFALVREMSKTSPHPAGLRGTSGRAAGAWRCCRPRRWPPS
jgi:hypothetical protein